MSPLEQGVTSRSTPAGHVHLAVNTRLARSDSNGRDVNPESCVGVTLEVWNHIRLHKREGLQTFT